MPTASEIPCSRCGQRHVSTREHGFYATNGHPLHPWTPQHEGEEMRISIGNHADLDGFHSALFGALHACDYCAAIVDRPDLDLHRNVCHPKDAA